MGVVTVEKDGNFTCMSNIHLKNKEMSLKAKGLLSVMLSLPPDWDYSTSGLATLSKDGRSAVSEALKELEKLGHLVRKRVYLNGKIIDWDYTVYEKPINVESENLESENQVLENLQLGNEAQLNTKELNTYKLNTKELNSSISKEIDCRTDVQRIVSAWNSLEPLGIKSVSKINSGTQRDSWVKARLKQYSCDEIIQAIENIRKSDFLQGKNKKGWSIKFDWFIRPNNFPKVLEGNFDNAVEQTAETDEERKRRIIEEVENASKRYL